MLRLLRTLRQEMGKTVVMVTHDPRALRFVDRVFHLDKGRLLAGLEAERAARVIEATLGVGERAPAAAGRGGQPS